jgi:hypothetical protein
MMNDYDSDDDVVMMTYNNVEEKDEGQNNDDEYGDNDEYGDDGEYGDDDG